MSRITSSLRNWIQIYWMRQPKQFKRLRIVLSLKATKDDVTREFCKRFIFLNVHPSHFVEILIDQAKYNSYLYSPGIKPKCDTFCGVPLWNEREKEDALTALKRK